MTTPCDLTPRPPRHALDVLEGSQARARKSDGYSGVDRLQDLDAILSAWCGDALAPRSDSPAQRAEQLLTALGVLAKRSGQLTLANRLQNLASSLLGPTSYELDYLISALVGTEPPCRCAYVQTCCRALDSDHELVAGPPARGHR